MVPRSSRMMASSSPLPPLGLAGVVIVVAAASAGTAGAKAAGVFFFAAPRCAYTAGINAPTRALKAAGCCRAAAMAADTSLGGTWCDINDMGGSLGCWGEGGGAWACHGEC